MTPLSDSKVTKQGCPCTAAHLWLFVILLQKRGISWVNGKYTNQVTLPAVTVFLTSAVGVEGSQDLHLTGAAA
jgi:hypothetical protein